MGAVDTAARRGRCRRSKGGRVWGDGGVRSYEGGKWRMRVVFAVESGQYLGRENVITGMWFYLRVNARYKRFVIGEYDK